MTDAETPRGRGPALAVASAGYFFVLLDVTIVNVALARIGSGLGGSRSELQWVVDAYALVLAAGMLGMGDLADRTGSRRLFLGGLVLFGGASALCAGGSALVLGPVLGDVLTGPLGWRSVFWLNVPLVAAALIGGALTLPPGSRTKGARLDLAGQFLGTAPSPPSYSPSSRAGSAASSRLRRWRGSR
jgi:DHA2 family methylenomycin A resistance protein-like MFS transporter